MGTQNIQLKTPKSYHVEIFTLHSVIYIPFTLSLDSIIRESKQTPPITVVNTKTHKT